ncbi:ATP-binding response regulator [Terricaulis silvestris]|uniref:histidine kinase n=1 Tax=Terricaulis silvestris TaxID=2686094 RepID=A0A6I6MRN3_9CAUL|nr:ATP-binding protein [Terricaulis silvestris]QGZ96086.1 Autoinducer 2 sensor kinase/phosphatase LuxQ [Terricaulis silvestris]
MQYFINHAAIERAAEEAFTGPRARYVLFGVIALAAAAAAGLAVGAIWLGLALLVDAGRNAFAARLQDFSVAQMRAAHLALDIVSATSLVCAPAIAWYARGELGVALAVAMLFVLLTHTAFSARRGRMHTLAACTPYAFVGLVFLLEAAAADAFWLITACALMVGYAFAATLHHSHRAAHARMQDAEWVRQLNMSFGDAASAAWEIDFTRERLVGAPRLAALLGRPVTYRDVVENGCFAPAADKALVSAAFAPSRGAVRRIALEHEVLGADGSRRRVRHQGFVRTTPDGAPVRLTCVTRDAAAVAASPALPRDVTEAAAAALVSQNEQLKTLSNELTANFDDIIADAGGTLAQILRTLAERSPMVERGIDDLAHARDDAETANLAKSQFLANMSHELRTPLNAIIGYAEMLQEDAEDSGDKATVQDLNRILTAAKHLLSLINEILDLSKIESGRMDVTAAPFDATDMLKDLIETVRPIAEQNGNTLRLNAAYVRAVNSDSMKLGQCVLNLLSNAAKFTKNGRIDIELSQRACNGVEQVFIVVRDTGIGMSKEHMSRLFQPFVQADPSITQQYGGTGLGLTITRRFAQLLGGDVTVQSALGEGAAFTLHVPVDFSDASAALGAAAKIDEVQGAEGAPLVIVIEDEPDARELAARALTRAGFAVQGVGGGEAGLALARAKSPALVLLDIFLPDRSGWRVLQSLKHDPKTQDIPVVVLSVNEDRAHALALGAAEHIVKPADRDMLAATVMRFARLPARQEAAPSPTAQKAAS